MSIARNLIIVFLLYIITVSCLNKKKVVQELDCYKINIEHETTYDDENNISTYEQMQDFNSITSKSIDIVRIKTESAYNTNTTFKRIYIENNEAFLFENDKLEELSEQNYLSLIKNFENIEESNSTVYCSYDSSRKVNYSFYVRVNNQLIMTFSYNNDFEKLDKYIAEKELKYIRLFESISN